MTSGMRLRKRPSPVTLNGIELKVRVARGFLERARGLIGRPKLREDEALLIPKCNAIHTCFMRYPIDARFLDRKGNPVREVKNIRPWRLFVWGGWRARSVLETASRS